jgi:hypothetical protein
MVRTLALGMALAGLGLGALAQPPAGPVRVTGVFTAMSAGSLSIKDADGRVTVFTLPSTYTVVHTHPVDIEAIKPGSFVATANTNIDATTGKSIELRIFEPGSHLGEGSRPMAQPNTTMTNATVQTVTKGAGGRELDVAYPGGTRHIIVPPEVKVIGTFPGDPADLKPGVTVNLFAPRGPDGAPIATRVSIVDAQP